MIGKRTMMFFVWCLILRWYTYVVTIIIRQMSYIKSSRAIKVFIHPKRSLEKDVIIHSQSRNFALIWNSSSNEKNALIQICIRLQDMCSPIQYFKSYENLTFMTCIRIQIFVVVYILHNIASGCHMSATFCCSRIKPQ